MVDQQQSATPTPNANALKVLYRLRHIDYAFRFAWSPDGLTLVVPAGNTTLVWSFHAKPTAHELPRQSFGAAFSPKGNGFALFSTYDVAVFSNGPNARMLWDYAANDSGVGAIAWAHTSNLIAVGDRRGNVELLDGATGSLQAQLELASSDHRGHSIRGLSWSSNGQLLAVASDDGVQVLDARASGTFKLGNRKSESVAWSPDIKTLASAVGRSVELWDASTKTHKMTLEGHVDLVTAVSYSSDGSLLASIGRDDSTCIWRTRDGQMVAILPGSGEVMNWRHVTFHPSRPLLATLDDQDKTVCIVQVDVDSLLSQKSAPSSTRYATAKIALVGDGSVGKTTLGHRMIAGEFRTFPRTHGQQFWPYSAVSDTRADGTECEAILWDLAGQSDYRLTHALFVDDADVAVIMFNASDRQQPLKGVEYWLNALRQRRSRQCRTVLVGAQLDTGEPAITQREILAFCILHDITGGYIGTSARTGQGVEQLVDALARIIPWNELPATVTTSTFKRIKDFVLSLKSTSETPTSPLELKELRTLLEQRDGSWHFTNDELSTALGHLEDHGYVAILQMSTGGRRILLAPDMLINLTASIVNEARANPRGLGALSESDLLAGRLRFPELAGAEEDDCRVLLDAATALFLEHNVCFRERLGSDTLLVFPALIHQIRPETEAAALVEDVSFEITGATDRFYATLVVLLGYTNTLTRTNQWQHQAQYETAPGQVCGFKQIDESEGRMILGLYYGVETSPHTRRLFEGLVETFLAGREVGVVKYPAVDCPGCGYRQDRGALVRRIRDGKAFMGCVECTFRIDLPRVGDLVLKPSERSIVREDSATARRRTEYETALTYVKGLVRDRGALRRASCFVSYACGSRDHERWVAGLVDDLLRADIDVVFDQRDSAVIGRDIARFICDGITQSDFVAVVGTPSYLDKYVNKTYTSGTIVAAEVDLIHQRLTGPETDKDSILPLLRLGERPDSFPPLLRGRYAADFRRDENYFVALFDLVLTLHAIPVQDPAVAHLRQSLLD